MSIRLEARNRGNIRLDMDNASLAAKYAREAGAAEKAAELSAANAAGAAERADAAAEAALRAEAGAQSAAVHLPQPGENGTWLVWDQAGDSYVDSGENCTGVQGEHGLKGDTGDKGDKGDTGSKGDDGVSPTVTVTDITGGHRVTITDANHPQGQPFDVMDGEVAQEDFDELSGDIDDLKSAKAPVIIDTASGTIASFEDGADGMPLKSLTVNIEPVQAAGTPTPETPLPISGRTSCNILQYADSILAASQFRQGRLASGGTFSSNTTNRCATRVFIPVLPNTQYTIATNAGIQCIAVHYYTGAADDTWLYRDAIAGQVSTITTPANCNFVRLMVAKNNTSDNIIPAEITIAIMTATAAIAVSLPAEAGTVYGGTMDVTSGVLTITDANIASYNGESLPGAWISDRDVYSAGATPSIGAQVVYRLADPSIYQLTPQEVTTLLGTNNIWADCGSVSVDYPADTKLYIQKINAPTDDDMTADSQIASGKYFIIGNNLYLSTTTIPAGDTIIPGTNCVKTDLAAALNALNT